MVHQSKPSQSSRISDATPTLIGSNSTSSLDDTPPLSPSGFNLPHHSYPSSAQELALLDGYHIQLGNSHEAWWSRRSAGSDPLNSIKRTDIDPQKEPPKCLMPYYEREFVDYDSPRPCNPTSDSLGQLDDTSNTERLPFDACTEKSDSSFHTAGSINTVLKPEPQEGKVFNIPAEYQRSSTSLQLEQDPDLAQPSSVNVSVTPPSPEMGLATACTSSLSLPSQSLLGPISVDYLPYSETHFNDYLYEPSRPNSSILAHCDQHSLSPPCETLTQTHPGRSTLRQAGVPHGSPRALALSLPLENIPDKDAGSLAPSFLQKLARKTFARSSPTIRRPSYPSLATTSGATLTGDQAMRRPRLSRHSMSFSFTRMQPLAPERKSAQNLSKKSRWWIIRRFIAKPDIAVRGIADDMRTQYSASTHPTSQDVHGPINGRSSCLSFFGDPMGRVDPFARPGGLGATISEADSPERYGYSLPSISHWHTQQTIPLDPRCPRPLETSSRGEYNRSS